MITVTTDQYLNLTHSARSQLKKANPAAYQRCRNELAGRRTALENVARTAKTIGERDAARAEWSKSLEAGTEDLPKPAPVPRPVEPQPVAAQSASQRADAAQEAAYRARPELRPKSSGAPITNEQLDQRMRSMAHENPGMAMGVARNVPPAALEAYNNGRRVMAARQTKVLSVAGLKAQLKSDGMLDRRPDMAQLVLAGGITYAKRDAAGAETLFEIDPGPSAA